MTQPSEPREPREPLRALAVPMRRIVEFGLLGWALALVVILAVPALHAGERDWWPWCAVAGLVLGGIGYAVWRRRAQGATHA